MVAEAAATRAVIRREGPNRRGAAVEKGAAARRPRAGCTAGADALSSALEMSTNGHESPRPSTALDDHRRWLIGIVITVLFGLFSVIMTLVSYNASRASPAPPEAPAAVAPQATEAPAAIAPQSREAPAAVAPGPSEPPAAPAAAAKGKKKGKGK